MREDRFSTIRNFPRYVPKGTSSLALCALRTTPKKCYWILGLEYKIYASMMPRSVFNLLAHNHRAWHLIPCHYILPSGITSSAGDRLDHPNSSWDLLCRAHEEDPHPTGARQLQGFTTTRPRAGVSRRGGAGDANSSGSEVKNLDHLPVRSFPPS